MKDEDLNNSTPAANQRELNAESSKLLDDASSSLKGDDASGVERSVLNAIDGSLGEREGDRRSLRESIHVYAKMVLSANPAESITQRALAEALQKKYTDVFGRYSLNYLYAAISGIARQPNSWLAQVDEGYGIYLRPDAPTSAAPDIDFPDALENGDQGDINAGEDNDGVGQGRDGQLEEKFRAIYMLHSSHFGNYPVKIEHTKGERRQQGFNKWKYPDLIELGWNAGIESGNIDKTSIHLKSILGEQPFRLDSIELKVELTTSSFRENFFQCVSNSMWAHRGALVVACKVEDKQMADELRRLGTSFGIAIISFGLNKGFLMKLPSASEILSGGAEFFEKEIQKNISLNTISPGKARANLDWSHIEDVQNLNPDFKSVFPWIAKCLADHRAYLYSDYLKLLETETKLLESQKQLDALKSGDMYS